MSTIGARLKEERKRLGFNQGDFATVAGVTRRPYSEWESGNTSPTAVQLSAMAAAGADVRYIVTGDREGPPPLTMTADERELLALFRTAGLTGKAAAIGALQGATGGMSAVTNQQNVHGGKAHQHNAPRYTVQQNFNGPIGEMAPGDIINKGKNKV